MDYTIWEYMKPLGTKIRIVTIHLNAHLFKQDPREIILAKKILKIFNTLLKETNQLSLVVRFTALEPTTFT